MMNAPGSYSLFAGAITAALSAQPQTAIEDLEGMLACTLVARFQYGSAGTTCIAVVQITEDGTNWIDVARFDFATASAVKAANLNGLLSKAVAALSALGAEGVVDGVLSDKMRCVITSTGTYANTTLSVRVIAR